ncbi:ParB/RepB/Spo0J family partition protein [Mycobacterium colombiense]|uniref:ParB/RepB/Spo0J family partition protein n=1 Tax=Mycobacterium colombiense TaxID=339268 RepID=UPI0012DB59DF|nr:ParB N-terminal domain-containing protein [Mycobacterium colombiense]
MHQHDKGDRVSACPTTEWLSRESSLPVENVPITAIHSSHSPRKNKANERHIKILAQSPVPLPPIVIHRTSMRVIDGVHRLRATQLRGKDLIAAKFFDGSDAEAFALAVHLNVTHGLPLTLSERKAAARRILLTNPHRSDRSIGVLTGVSNKTVAMLRRCLTGEDSHSDVRLGRDGKTRPISPIDGRRRAAEFLSTNPAASLREIARTAGVSVSTARDVRARFERGENPLPDSLAKASSPCPRPEGQASPGVQDPPAGGRSDTHREAHDHDLLERLRNDPAVRFSDRGRRLVRLLSTDMAAIGAVNAIAENIPIHCSGTVAEIARRNASAWQEVANKFQTV